MKTLKMPMLFIGHGSPMNAIEDTVYSRSWKEIGKNLPTPEAIVIFSAHWITEGRTMINTNEKPDMIYDMYGFPSDLYTVNYPAPGNPEKAKEIIAYLESNLEGYFHEDATRGFDHGVWSTLIHLFPHADIPVICISLDYQESPSWFYNLGKMLNKFRHEGIMIIGSGNIVHNLPMIDWSGENIGYPWAKSYDERIALDILEGNTDDILSSLSWKDTKLAQPSHDHLLPLFPLIGASEISDTITFYTPTLDMGSLSMRSILWK